MRDGSVRSVSSSGSSVGSLMRAVFSAVSTPCLGAGPIPEMVESLITGYSPEAIGDYIAGPNHVLPTSGTAKFSSGLSVYDFLKRQSIVKITKTGIERLGPSVINLAEYENLHGHANSVRVRIKKR